LNTSEILPIRTRGGSSTRASHAQPSKKPQKQSKRATRKLVMPKYDEEEVTEEEASSLISREDRAKQA